MDIAVLGTGHIGGTLAKKWVKSGHRVHFGARDPKKTEVQALLQALGKNATAYTIAEAIRMGQAVLFAVPGTAMEETIASNAKVLDGKLVIDAANKMGGPVTNSRAVFEAHVPTARYVRAFNCYGWENFENPLFKMVAADQFYCAPDGEPRTIAEQLIADVGLNPVYLGGPEQADVIDGVLRLWFTLAAGQKMGRHLAFKVLRD